MQKLVELIEAFPAWNWDYDRVSFIIPLDIISKNPSKKWNLARLYSRKDFTFQFVVDNLNLNWDWSILSSIIPLETILFYPHLPWNWEYVSFNPTLTTEFVIKNPDKPWNTNMLLERCFIEIRDTN